MRVNCNIGAIIKITRRGLPDAVGRVTAALEHEVTICLQSKISSVGLSPEYDYQKCSADTKTILHINSDLIDDWTFATLDDLSQSSTVRYSDEKQWSSVILNFYGEDGFCKG